MASAGSTAKQGLENDGVRSFRERLKAWWEGYDLSPDDGRGGGAVRTGKAGERGAGRVFAEPFVAWSETHLEVLQSIWGPGMIGPSPPEFIRHLVKPLGLNPAMSVLDVGCGLGGSTRVMAETFGAWISGLESEAQLVSAGMAMSEAAGMDKKAPIAIFDPDVCEPKARTYDCVVSFGYLYRVKDKLRLIEALDIALKNGGQMLMTDFVLTKAGAMDDPVQAWLEGEPEEVEPWSVAQYSRALTERGLEVRITEDISETVRKRVVGSWADHMAKVGQEAGDPRTAETLVREVELWTRRVKALQEGNLRVYRIYALKQGRNNLLSDW